MKAFNLPNLARYPTYLATFLALDLLALQQFSGTSVGDAMAEGWLLVGAIGAQVGIEISHKRWRLPVKLLSRLLGGLASYGVHWWGIISFGARQEGFSGMLPFMCVVFSFTVGSVLLQRIFELGPFGEDEDEVT